MDKISKIMIMAKAKGYGPHYGKFVADHPEVLKKDAVLPRVLPEDMYECVFCGKEFYQEDRQRRKYCCEECRLEAAKVKSRKAPEGYNKICPVCGKTFHTYTARRIYCDDLCKQFARTKTVKGG